MERPSRSEMFRAKMKQENGKKITSTKQNNVNKLPAHKRITRGSNEKTR